MSTQALTKKAIPNILEQILGADRRTVQQRLLELEDGKELVELIREHQADRLTLTGDRLLDKMLSPGILHHPDNTLRDVAQAFKVIKEAEVQERGGPIQQVQLTGLIAHIVKAHETDLSETTEKPIDVTIEESKEAVKEATEDIPEFLKVK